MLISSLAFADATDAYECLLELRIYTPAPLSSVVKQILIVRIFDGGFSAKPFCGHSYTDKNLFNILPPKRTQKGHKKDTDDTLFENFSRQILYLF